MARRPSEIMWRRLFALRPGDLRPLQVRIRTMVVDAVLDGMLTPGMPLPSGRGLATELGISRNTVILAYQRPDVVDADLADYFGSIPHLELMKSVARRIVDPRVLHLMRSWLDCAVEEADGKGRKTRTTAARDQRCGIPQGSPISPLLANLYMRRFVLGWRKLGLGQRFGARLVTYADDFVILCRKGNAQAALDRMRGLMGS